MPLKLPDLSTASSEELAETKLRFEDEIFKINLQIDAAKERGSVDRGWLRKAESARRMYGRDCQRIQIEQGRRKKSHTISFERRFIEAARRRLNEEVYKSLMDEALEA